MFLAQKMQYDCETDRHAAHSLIQSGLPCWEAKDSSYAKPCCGRISGLEEIFQHRRSC